MIPAEPVGLVVARGEVEIGFQQISELKPIAGIQLLGPLPDEVQKITLFSAGIVVGSKEPDPAKNLAHLPKLPCRHQSHHRQRPGAQRA